MTPLIERGPGRNVGATEEEAELIAQEIKRGDRLEEVADRHHLSPNLTAALAHKKGIKGKACRRPILLDRETILHALEIRPTQGAAAAYLNVGLHTLRRNMERLSIPTKRSKK